MKRLFLLGLLCAMLAVSVRAQKQDFSPHPPISFNGLSMECSLESMIKKLLSLGYRVDKYELWEAALLMGSFQGYPAAVMIGTDDRGFVKDITWSIVPDLNWKRMHDLFFAVELELAMAFGFPDVRIDTSDRVKGSGWKKIKALKNDEIEVRTNYFYEKGGINMWLGYLSTPVIMVFYKLDN